MRALKKSFIIIILFLFQKCNKFVRVSSKAYIDTLSILMTRVREDANFVSLLQLQTSCSFGTFPKAAHRVAIGTNRQIVIAKPKSEPIMTKSLGVAEDFSPERGQPPGFHVGPIRACDRFYLWEPNYRF